ncbi:substrate-binding periplasmic protein [candidate division CSSED10-310 bacterium]|uniref:Substrate-binding periplasmic protein n=1 Tax=candidate division CSSED10-310 bacterium TaxID=2855610 RepID=A0ABV6YXF8_UNCC1
MTLQNRTNHLAGIFLVLVFLISPPAAVSAEDVVLMLSNNNWPPFFFGRESDTEKGIAREILEHCLTKMGYAFEFKFYTLRRMHHYMEQGKLDIAIYSYKKSREAYLIYGQEPLFSAVYRPIVRADSDIKISSISDFDNYKLGHLAGLQYSDEFFEYTMKRAKEGTLVIMPSEEVVLDLLLKQHIDVFVSTDTSILYRAKQRGILDKIKILDFEIRTSIYRVTFSKKSKSIKNKKDFLKQLDQCIRTLKAEGHYKKILDKYR